MKLPNPRVVFFATNLARGGAETQVVLLAKALRQKEWPVTVISLLSPTAFLEELHAVGIEVLTPRMKPGRPGVLALLRLIWQVRKLQPAILHAHLFHANLLARLLRFICPLPVVISTIHSLAESGQSSSKIETRDRLYRITGWLADATVSVSDAVATRHIESGAVSSRRSHVIRNGADPGVFRRDPARRDAMRAELGLRDEFVWLAAGRLMWKKDYATMLKAMAFQENGVLLIAGEGPQEAELGDLAKQLGAKVRFLGLRTDLPALMNAADAFVLSSVVEGLPMVLIEASLAGLPVVATNVGGVGEVVVHENTGFLAEPSNPALLGTQMKRLASLPEESRRAMGEAALRHAIETFDIEAVSSQWEVLYRDCLARARRRIEP